jgi:hypothetical protein
MFDLKSPCINCPFRKGVGSKFGLRQGRLDSIRLSEAFQCHRTVDYVDTDADGIVAEPGDRPQQCAGLMAVLHRIGQPNTIMQIAERLGGHLQPHKLDPRGEAYDDWMQVLRAHTEGVEP